ERRLLEDDSDAQIILLRARSQLAAKRGVLDEAEAFAHRANERAERIDDLSLRGGVLADLAALYELSGRPEDAKAALEQALALYDKRGDTPSGSGRRAEGRARRVDGVRCTRAGP